MPVAETTTKNRTTTRSRTAAGKTTARRSAKAAAAAEGAADPPLPSTARIIDAAVRLFATKGYWSSSLEEVAAMAGFTKGAVYYYFKSKERLLLEVLKAIEARSIDATAVGVKAQAGSPASQLETFVKFQTRWAAQYPEDLAIIMLMSIETARTKSKVRTLMLQIYRKITTLLEEIIEAGKLGGEFAPDIDTKDTVLYLVAVHDGNMVLWYRSGTDEEIGRKLTRATLAGFRHAVARTS